MCSNNNLWKHLGHKHCFSYYLVNMYYQIMHFYQFTSDNDMTDLVLFREHGIKGMRGCFHFEKNYIEDLWNISSRNYHKYVLTCGHAQATTCGTWSIDRTKRKRQVPLSLSIFGGKKTTLSDNSLILLTTLLIESVPRPQQCSYSLVVISFAHS